MRIPLSKPVFRFQGSEFSKELVQTLAERAELEANYARGLQKLSAKLFKATKDLSSGTISNAWHVIAEDMEATADTHRTIAGALTDELVRPLKAFVEAQHKTRKSVEAVVDKRSESVNDEGFAAFFGVTRKVLNLKMRA